MKYITLDTIKSHLNIDSGFTADDAYLEMLWDVTLDVIEKHIDHKLSELAILNDGALPATLKQASLLLLGSFYANREHVSYSGGVEVPNTFSYLISLYKDYSGESTKVTETELLEALEDNVVALQSKTIAAIEPATVTVSGDTTTVAVNNIDLGEY